MLPRKQILGMVIDNKLNFKFHLKNIFDALVPFVQFKKREKHPWMSVTFSKVAS